MGKDSLLQSLVLVILVLAIIFVITYLGRGNNLRDLVDYIPFLKEKKLIECVDDRCPEGYYCNTKKGICKKETFLNKINLKDIDIHFK
jgi:hypothetical protein